ncbi:PhaM family polyhydroxyalkanoate granule multifunctional regulatory protein [Pandoraea pulmonicola]|uniref:Uncharacterized protein n=1 Tax=Pandoraea pulmonicola TaxID=93221 RepID=A0AAJ5D0G8_PANPU|nr:PhaM family polyhydroxyalkanoate granule multifunctional regulatory protein [Pandoraea pulmonicola]APD13301.1 hypothetical protein RO07_10650 [Pandoraea pulmonicola]SUA90637.1 Uncharacterised protein [Pandoraea pulmonicola]
MSDSTSAMPNGFDILKKMWEAFSPPATFTSPLTQLMQSTAPLLDPNEIENRIAEMRAVEQWLTLNLNVLRSTIQAFEVQRATYATLRAFGSGSFGAGDDAAASKPSAAGPQESAATGANFWRSPFATPEPAEHVAPRASTPEPEPEAEPEAATAQDAPPKSDEAQSPFAQAGNAYTALDPSLWFNAMRAQFDQIAAAAQAAGMSAAQMTEAAATQMSQASTKAEQAAAKTSDKRAGKAPTKGAATGSASGAKAAKRAPASRKTPAKPAAAKTSAKTVAKASTKTSAAAGEAGKPAGKQAAWKW